jgi:hypothetical protein
MKRKAQKRKSQSGPIVALEVPGVGVFLSPEFLDEVDHDGNIVFKLPEGSNKPDSVMNLSISDE